MQSVAVGLAILLMLSETSFAQEAPDRLTDFRSKRSFYEQSGFGALALMPNVQQPSQARIEHQYIAMTRSGYYENVRDRMKSSDWWFVINHRSTAFSDRDSIYVGVLAVKRQKLVQREPIALYRNSGWFNPANSRLGEFDGNYASLESFLRLQSQIAIYDAFSRVFGEWHARPREGDEESSWRLREYWEDQSSVRECFERAGGGDWDPSRLLFEAKLIRFAVTSGTNSQSPLTWYTGVSDTGTLFVRTFSPTSQALYKEYCLALD